MDKDSSLNKARIKWAWIFLTPALAILFFVAGFPLLRTIWFSFTDATLDNLDSYGFANVFNYYYIFTDVLWWKAVLTTVKFTVYSVLIETILGIAIALILNRDVKGRGLLRAAILIPWAIPTVVSSQIWGWLYHDQFGFINGMLRALHLIKEPIAFMGNKALLLPTIVAVDVWKTTPFITLLVLAGLTTISGSLYEAAAIDGAGPIQRFFKITLPLLKPTLLVTLVFRTLDAFRVFDIIYIMQGSNENTASVSIYARQQMIDFQEIGIGAAASVAIFLLISIFIVVYLKILKVDFNK